MRWKAEDPARRAAMGARGGLAASKRHRFTSEEARAAGAKGGRASIEARRCKKCRKVPARGVEHVCPKRKAKEC